MAKLTLTYRDYGTPGEKSSAQFIGSDLTAINFDAEMTLQDALRDACDDISLGVRVNRVTIAVASPSPDEQPASAFAQRESKWLVRYKDTVTGDRGTAEIPCADQDQLDPTANDKADLTGTEMAAFVTAFEAYVLSPGTGTRGNTEVVEIVYVGRNY